MALFQVFWDATAQVIEINTWAGAHLRRHTASNKETTLNFLYSLAFTSMSQFIEKTMVLLVDHRKK